MIRYVLSRAQLFLVLLSLWFLLALNFRLETVIMGLVICWAITEASYKIVFGDRSAKYSAFRIDRMFVYVLLLFVEIAKSSVRYMVNLVSRKYKPVVFDVKLDVKNPIDISIIANSITLTPGTITINSDIEKKTVTVLTIAKPGTSVEELAAPIRKRFERKLNKSGDRP